GSIVAADRLAGRGRAGIMRLTGQSHFASPVDRGPVMKHPRWLPLGLLVVSLAAGCARARRGAGGQPPPKGDVRSPRLHTVTDYEEYTGRTDAVRSVELKSQVTGYLKEVRFKEGDRVEQDQVLFVIDDRTFQADLKKALADVKKAESQIKLSQARLVQL